MNNSDKYYFSDFTLSHYKEILSKLKENHIFSAYHDYDVNSIFVLKRHDVDFSLDNALKMAKIEYDMGVKSTYFLMLHSEFYNLLEYKNIEIVKEIKLLGHEIGLHFDSEFYKITNENLLDEKIVFEKTILENFTSQKIESFSFHNPTNFILNCKREKYGGLINCYSKYFNENVCYCSDSNGYWRYNRMIDYIEKNKEFNLQILTHPVWWTEKIRSPKEKIELNIKRRAQTNLKMYENILAKHNRENINW